MRCGISRLWLIFEASFLLVMGMEECVYLEIMALFVVCYLLHWNKKVVSSNAARELEL